MTIDDTSDGTLSTAMSQDGVSALPASTCSSSEQKGDADPAPAEGEEAEGGTAKDGEDDHLKED